jgi:hypothetical protein
VAGFDTLDSQRGEIMPNWIGNYLTVAGPDADVRRFVRQARGRHPGSKGAPPGREVSFNFHSLVPLPPRYSQVPYDNVAGTGARGWDLEMKTWGIKWGAVEPWEPLLSPGMAHYRFDTAWGAPTEFLGKVYASWPTLVFLLSWGGEGPVRGTAWFAGNRSIQDESEWPDGWPDYPREEDYDLDAPAGDAAYRLAVQRAAQLCLSVHPVFVTRFLAQRAGFSTETPLRVLYDWVLERDWQHLARGLGCSSAFWPEKDA